MKNTPLKKNTILKKFLIRSAVIFVSWSLCYYGYIKPNDLIDPQLTDLVVKASVDGLNLLGYSASHDTNVISINSKPNVLVSDSCNGLELFVLYMGFILAFPGKVRFKIIFVPIGVVLLFFANIIREIALALNYQYFQKTFEFNHHYTYALIVYSIVFLLWRFWMLNYSVLSANEKN